MGVWGLGFWGGTPPVEILRLWGPCGVSDWTGLFKFSVKFFPLGFRVCSLPGFRV